MAQSVQHGEAPPQSVAEPKNVELVVATASSQRTTSKLAVVEEGVPTSTQHDSSARSTNTVRSTNLGKRALPMYVEGSAGHTFERNTWVMTCVLMLAEVMGTGVLSLPAAAAKTGWILAMVSVVAFAGAAAYSGMLLSQTRNEYFPAENSYSEMARKTGGDRFALFTLIMVLINWGLLLPYFLISVGDSIELIFYSEWLCSYQKSLIGAVLMILPLQCPDFHAISFISYPSAAAIIIAVICSLAQLETVSDVKTSASPDPDEDFISLYGSFASFIFAYQGQSMFLELMREMKDGNGFPRASFSAYLVMCIVYAVTVVMGYAGQGDQIASFLPDSMKDGGVKRFVGILLVFHVVVAYVVTGQPLHRFIHSKLFPSTVNFDRPWARLHWSAAYPLARG